MKFSLKAAKRSKSSQDNKENKIIKTVMKNLYTLKIVLVFKHWFPRKDDQLCSLPNAKSILSHNEIFALLN